MARRVRIDDVVAGFVADQTVVCGKCHDRSADLVRSGPYARGGHDRLGALGCHAPHAELVDVLVSEAFQRWEMVEEFVVKAGYGGIRREHIYLAVAPALQLRSSFGGGDRILFMPDEEIKAHDDTLVSFATRPRQHSFAMA